MKSDERHLFPPRPDQSLPFRGRGPGLEPTRLRGLLRSLRDAPSRRDVLHGLAATGFALGLTALPHLAEAKPKRRKKRKRPKPAEPNQYGCLEVNDPCRRHLQCCSGICTGKPGKKRCVPTELGVAARQAGERALPTTPSCFTATVT